MTQVHLTMVTIAGFQTCFWLSFSLKSLAYSTVFCSLLLTTPFLRSVVHIAIFSFFSPFYHRRLQEILERRRSTPRKVQRSEGCADSVLVRRQLAILPNLMAFAAWVYLLGRRLSCVFVALECALSTSSTSSTSSVRADASSQRDELSLWSQTTRQKQDIANRP